MAAFESITLRSTRVVTPETARCLQVPNSSGDQYKPLLPIPFPHLRIDISVCRGSSGNLGRVFAPSLLSMCSRNISLL